MSHRCHVSLSESLARQSGFLRLLETQDRIARNAPRVRGPRQRAYLEKISVELQQDWLKAAFHTPNRPVA